MPKISPELADEIEIEDNEPSAGVEIELSDEGDGEDGSKGGKSTPVSDDEIFLLKKELDEAKAAAKRGEHTATTAISRATEAETKAKETESRLTGEVENRLKAQEDTIVAGVSSTEGELKALKETLAAQYADGKWTEAAETTEQITDAKQRLREFSTQKAQIAAYRETAKRQPQNTKTDPETPQVSSRTQAWIAAHPKFTTDRKYYAKAMYLHEEAIGDGLPVDSDEYFKHIEEGLGEREPVKEEPKIEAKPKVEVKKSAPVAPAQRRAESTPPKSNKITLTGDEVEQADSLFGDPQSALYIKDPKERYTYYYKGKERLQSEGKIK